jgi:hypothetical protein
MNIFQKFFGHLKTVIKHRREVRKLCFKCGLYWRGLTHDLSKFSPVEFINGVRYFTGHASPHLGERADKGYSEAWLNHKAKNKHHAEYWQDLKGKPATMPKKYVVEMICDRIAASKIYLKDKYTDSAPLDYYMSHKDENQFSDCTRDRLEIFLEYLKDYGERETLQALRNWIK